MNIPRMVRGKPGAWDPQVCLAWGQQFLQWLQAIAQRDSDVEIPASTDRINDSRRSATPALTSLPSVWRVTFTPRVGVEVMRLDADGVREVEAGEDRVGFLPSWYWKVLHEGGVSTPPSTLPVDELRGSGEGDGVTKMPKSTIPSGWNI